MLVLFPLFVRAFLNIPLKPGQAFYVLEMRP